MHTDGRLRVGVNAQPVAWAQSGSARFVTNVLEKVTELSPDVEYVLDTNGLPDRRPRIAQLVEQRPNLQWRAVAGHHVAVETVGLRRAVGPGVVDAFSSTLTETVLPSRTPSIMTVYDHRDRIGAVVVAGSAAPVVCDWLVLPPPLREEAALRHRHRGIHAQARCQGRRRCGTPALSARSVAAAASTAVLGVGVIALKASEALAVARVITTRALPGPHRSRALSSPAAGRTHPLSGYWSTARGMRREVRRWWWCLVAWVVLPSRLPPRRGLLHTAPARRSVTLHLKRSGVLRCRVAGFYSVVEVFALEQYALPYLDPQEVRVVVDIGANGGAATVWLATRYPNARVVAVEPGQEAVHLLRQNIRRNGLDARVDVMPVAIGGTSGRGHLVRGGTSVNNCVLSTGVEAGAGDEVDILNLEDLLEKAELSGVDVLKLDCEGAGYPLLLEAPPDRLRRVTWIVGEFHRPGGRDPRNLAAHLAPAGFHCEITSDGPVAGLFRARRAQREGRPR